MMATAMAAKKNRKVRASALEHFCGKLRSALQRGDVDAARTHIDLQLGEDEDGHQLSIEEEADAEATIEK
jgi:hypothetical protein